MKIFLLTLAIASIAIFSHAHGFVELADDNHLISVFMAPLSPSAGEKQSVLVSFVHNLSLISEPLNANVTVKKNGEVLSLQSKRVTDGVGSFTLTYPEQGIYEVFVTFARESEPGNIYAPEDIFVQVKNGAESKGVLASFELTVTVIALVVGLLAGWLIGRKTK